MSALLWPITMCRLLLQSMALAMGQIWTNKLRSILTTLGIIIGVAAVTAVIAALTGLKTFVLDEFQTLGTNKIFMWPDRPDTGRFATASWRVIRFRPEHFDGWETECSSVAALTRMQELRGSVRFGDRVLASAQITGIEPHWHQIENRFVTLGRPFSSSDQSRFEQVCIISTEMRDDLQMDRDCTGQSILINNRRFTVVGLVEPNPESAFGFGDSSSRAEVYIPFSTAWRMNEGWMQAVGASRSPEVSEDAIAELRALLRKNRRLLPEDPDTFEVEAVQRAVDQFKKMSAAISIVAFGIVAISLVVGGIGIMNIMLVSVSERTREIGLRKAVGARRSAILFQFLVEAITLCFFGGLVGLAFGQGVTLLLTQIPDSGLGKAYIPIWAMAMSFGFAALVGVVFGMFPAIKAARLDPIEALRHE